MKLKKILLGISTGIITASPIVFAISCGTKNLDGTITYENNVLDGREKVKNPLGTISKNNGWKSILALGMKEAPLWDKSFAESAYRAIIDQETKKIMPIAKKDENSYTRPISSEDKDFLQMYQSLEEKTLIIAPGYLHGPPLRKGANSIKNKAVILVDEDVAGPRIASILYKSNQSSFLAGYMAGVYLNENYEIFRENGLKVGTFGGMNTPPVVLFMMGFQNGIKYFNANKGDYKHNINFIDNGAKADYFSGDFSSGGGTPIVENLLAKKADLIFPVAGVQSEDVVNKLEETKNKITKIIGVDVAQEKDPTFKDHVVFSSVKKIKEGVMKMIEIVTGNKRNDEPGYSSFEGFGGLTYGDLNNELVGVSKGLDSNSKALIAWEKTNKKEIIDAAKSLKHNPFKFEY